MRPCQAISRVLLSPGASLFQSYIFLKSNFALDQRLLELYTRTDVISCSRTHRRCDLRHTANSNPVPILARLGRPMVRSRCYLLQYSYLCPEFHWPAKLVEPDPRCAPSAPPGSCYLPLRSHPCVNHRRRCKRIHLGLSPGTA